MIKLSTKIHADDPRIVSFDRFGNWFSTVALITTSMGSIWVLVEIILGTTSEGCSDFIVSLAVPIFIFMNTFWDSSLGLFGYRGFKFPKPRNKLINLPLHILLNIIGLFIILASIGLQAILIWILVF